MYHDVDRRWPHDPGVLRQRVEGVVDDDGHDRPARRQRHVEGALLEPSELPGGAARALGSDGDRQALAQRLHRGLERVDGARVVRAVDEDGASERAERTEQRIAADLLLGDADEVTVQQLAHDQHVDPALVVEGEHRRAVRPQVLLARHPQADAGQRAAELAEGGSGEVDDLPPASLERARGEPEQERRHQAAYRERRAQHVERARQAAGGERPARPAAPAGDGGEAPVRVGRPRVADMLEQRQVLVAVGVEVALVEVETVGGREAARSLQLALAVAQRWLDGAGEAAVAYLQPAAHHVLDAEVARERLDLVARGRRDDRHGVLAAAMRTHDRAGLGIDLRREAVGVETLADLLHRRLGFALQQSSGLGEELVEPELAELEAEAGDRGEREAGGSDAAADQPVEQEGHDREAGDEGAVEIEEGSDRGPRGSLVDLPRDVFEPRHGPWSIASPSRLGQPMAYPADGQSA